MWSWWSHLFVDIGGVQAGCMIGSTYRLFLVEVARLRFRIPTNCCQITAQRESFSDMMSEIIATGQIGSAGWRGFVNAEKVGAAPQRLSLTIYPRCMLFFASGQHPG